MVKNLKISGLKLLFPFIVSKISKSFILKVPKLNHVIFFLGRYCNTTQSIRKNTCIKKF